MAELLGVVLVAVTLAGRQSASAQEPDALAAARLLEQAFVDAIARAENSVVSIARVAAPRLELSGAGLDPFGLDGAGPDRDDPKALGFLPDQFGSGVLIEDPRHPDQRFVLTTYHVAFGERAASGPMLRAPLHVYVRLASGDVVQAEAKVRETQAEVHAADPRSDLAVLRLLLEEAGLTAQEVKPIALGEAAELRKGQLVLALGNPYAQARDGSASASIGIISNISRRPLPPDDPRGIFSEEAKIHDYGTLLQVDARLNLGTSGGALLNLDGRLIGITTSLAALQGYEKSVGYAIPFDVEIRRVIDQLLDGYEVEYGFLGIKPGTVTAQELQLKGLQLDRSSAVEAVHVAVDSPAWQAGMRNEDILLEINRRPLRDDADLMHTVGLLGPDAVAEVHLWRPHRAQDLVVQVRLGKWPIYDDSAIVSTARRFPSWRGLDLDYPTARRRFMSSDPLDRYRQAVVVTAVAPDSPAARAGFEVGDFIRLANGVGVQTPAQFHDAVRNLTGDVTLTLLDGRRRSIAPP